MTIPISTIRTENALFISMDIETELFKTYWAIPYDWKTNSKWRDDPKWLLENCPYPEYLAERMRNLKAAIR